jgi:hypothetical protein
MGRLVALTATFHTCRAEVVEFLGGHGLASDPLDGKSELLALIRISDSRVIMLLEKLPYHCMYPVVI